MKSEGLVETLSSDFGSKQDLEQIVIAGQPLGSL
jgi:hypothetical protein